MGAQKLLGDCHMNGQTNRIQFKFWVKSSAYIKILPDFLTAIFPS